MIKCFELFTKVALMNKAAFLRNLTDGFRGRLKLYSCLLKAVFVKKFNWFFAELISKTAKTLASANACGSGNIINF
jgi:hypothetical protein